MTDQEILNAFNAAEDKKQSTGKLELISAFCTGMSGTGAWLMGRFVELLLQWRDFGDAAELQDFLAEYYETEEYYEHQD